MTTEQQKFNCIFCKETFSNKEDLQIHFRKHGDPSFKTNAPNDSPNGSEKITEDNELVGCDVCEEEFPTISKAITHKHKVHPDHDAKYFCPFCGKLFTMKHLYNNHIKTNHDSELSIEKSDFHCDCCEVMFYLPSAMLYHNKFFHRQDVDLPSIGGSKKVKIYSKEMIQLFYCSFCGEEYNNKVNLHKHILEDHSDENQCPKEVLKCPLCEATFHHLDAYELHLMFHTTEDDYSERSEMADEIVEFSLETVPPIMEKVENKVSEDTNEEMDMENFLQLLIGESDDGGGEKQKSKKHKKHKKSKKAAITLDEFLNMNKDVFGDGLDVQGIEEVPSQVMLKKMQVKKCPANKAKALNADINKLQRIGITVKTKSGSNLTPIINRCTITQPTPKIIAEKSNSSSPNELLSKLMRQGNSQIKIIKKSATQNILEKNVESDISENIDRKDESDIQNEEKTCQDNVSSSNGEDKDDDDDENICNTTNNEIEQVEKYQNTKGEEVTETDNLKQDNIHSENKLDVSSPNTDEKISKSVSLSKSSPETDNVNEFNEDVKESSLSKSDKDLSDKECKDSDDNDDNIDNDSSNKTIGALKHLSHLIIKSVKPNKSVHDNKDSNNVKSTVKDTKNTSNNVLKTSEVPYKKVIKQQNNNSSNKRADTLKNLSKNVTIKSVANFDSDEFDEHNDYVEKNDCLNKISSKQYANETQTIKENTNLEVSINHTVKQIPYTKIDKERNNVSNNKPLKIDKPVKNKIIDDDIEIFNIDDSDSDDATNKQETKNNVDVAKKKEPQLSNVLLHNLGSNITIKSTSQKTNEVKRNETSGKKNIKQSNKVNKPTPEIQKSINLQNTLKNLGSNITIKSNNTSTTYSQEELHSFDEDDLQSDHFDSDSETEVGKVKITEVTEETSDVDEADNGHCDADGIIQSPGEEQDKDSDHFSNEEESDFDSKVNTTVLNQSDKITPKPKVPDNIKQLNKDLIIKSVKKNSPDNTVITPYENRSNISSKTLCQNSGPSSQVNTLNRNVNTSDDVRTVKTVKKYQTETVIEEITTVTRTIRTINESSNEVVQTHNQSPAISQTVNRNQPTKEFQQVKILRHPTPTGPKSRTFGHNVRLTNPTNIRIPNQIVPIRTTSHQARPITTIQRLPFTPGMQIVRKVRPVINNPLTQVTKKLKISPNVVKQLATKRPSEGNTNSVCNIKKIKDSTLSMATQSNAPTEQYTASTSRSEFSSVTKVVQGGKTATQTHSEVNTQQQLSRLSNMSGLKIMKRSTKQATRVEENSEVSASKRNTLEAIEKLQKHGLLVKKPRLDDDDESYEKDFFSESDEDYCEQ